ncbi:MAG: hypothetical protein ACI8PZ_005558 [Myxococcota bacterium]|jgi:hypothetical protein
MTTRDHLFAIVLLCGCVASTKPTAADTARTAPTAPQVTDTVDTAPEPVAHPLADPRHDDIQAIWQDRCRGCHTPAFPHSGLVLIEGGYEAIVGVPSEQIEGTLIAPGDPEGSYLLHKLRGTQVAAGGWGDTMPSGRDPVDAAVLQTIETWIAAGAPR